MENKLLSFPIKKNQWFLLLLIGILLIVIAAPVSGSEKESEAYGAVEQQMEKMLEQMEGVGDVSVMITYREEEQVEGILVISEHGENPVIIQKITEVLQALFDVDTHKIKVTKGI